MTSSRSCYCAIQNGVVISSGTRSIGDNFYFGAGAQILGDTKIGNNVVVVANGVVLTDVPTTQQYSASGRACAYPVGVPGTFHDRPSSHKRQKWQTQAEMQPTKKAKV